MKYVKVKAHLGKGSPQWPVFVCVSSCKCSSVSISKALFGWVIRYDMNRAWHKMFFGQITKIFLWRQIVSLWLICFLFSNAAAWIAYAGSHPATSCFLCVPCIWMELYIQVSVCLCGYKPAYASRMIAEYLPVIDWIKNLFLPNWVCLSLCKAIFLELDILSIILPSWANYYVS